MLLVLRKYFKANCSLWVLLFFSDYQILYGPLSPDLPVLLTCRNSCTILSLAMGVCFYVGKGTGFTYACLFVPCLLWKPALVLTVCDFMRLASVPLSQAAVQEPGRMESFRDAIAAHNIWGGLCCATMRAEHTCSCWCLCACNRRKVVSFGC